MSGFVRQLFTVAASLAIGLSSFSFSGLAQAEWSPPGPIKLMIGFAAGGGADTQARLIAEELEKRKGWKIIPEQVTGKGGTVLADALRKEPNDGTALGIIVTETLGYNAIASKNKNLALKNFTPLSTTCGFQMGIVALSKSEYTSYDKVVAAAKAGKKVRFAAMSPRLADVAYHLGKKTGVDFNIVMTKGGKGTMNAINAGDVDIGWGAGIQSKAVLAGDMVNIASGLSTKLDVSPDAPLITSLGSEFTTDGYFMFAGPAGMPPEARDAITAAIQEVVGDANSKANKFINKAFGGPILISGDKLNAMLEKDVEDAEKLIKTVSN